MVAKGKGGRSGKDWKLGISRGKLLYIGWINKVLLYSTGNYIQYPGGQTIKENNMKNIYLYICVTESLCCTAEINITL